MNGRSLASVCSPVFRSPRHAFVREWTVILPLLVTLMSPTALAIDPPDLTSLVASQSAEPEAFHFSHVDRGAGLMIETGCERRGNGDFISYDLDFPGRPDVVTCAQDSWTPMVACPANHASDGFYLSLIDHDGNAVAEAWVLWIAVYPHEYVDPRSGLMIETGCGQWGHGDFIPYDLDFPGAPRVVTCAQYGSTPKMACPVNHSADGFYLALKDHNGNTVDNAWVLWLAIYPSEVELESGLMIETGLSSQWGHSDHIYYDLYFAGAPRAVTCAQYAWTPNITCPVDIASDGFYLASLDHDGNPVSDAWTFFIAVYPSEYVEEPQPSPRICLSPGSLANSCQEGENASSQFFEVWNCGDGTLIYSISCQDGVDGDWQTYGQRYAIIVMGGHVEDGSQHYQWYWNDTYSMYTELVSYGFTDENIYFMSYGSSAEEHADIVDATPTTDNIRTAYEWAQQACTADDLLYVYWVDHGSTTSFQTYDGNITHVELGTLMDPIVAKQIIGAYNPCYSGAVIDDISRPGVITVTSQDASHPNSWGWAGQWRRALRGGTEEDPTDTDGDGYISMTEAYLWICPRSQEAGEHSMYDDNGDGVGHECTDAGFDPNDPTKDGYIGKFYSLDGWRESEGAAWLYCDPTGGDSTGEPDTIQVNFETVELPCGSYSATIVVSSPDAENSPQTIPVSLTVCSSCTGDLDCDHDVDLADLAALLAAYGCGQGEPCYMVCADLDDDGQVGLPDLSALLAVYGTSCD
jgi:hypothetical protein